MGCDYDSPSSSPPTPPSPLPISIGAGNHKYNFSCSPSPSPPFSPPLSSHASSENLHPLLQKLASPKRVPSAFSLDRPDPDALDSKSSCLEDLDAVASVPSLLKPIITFLQPLLLHRCPEEPDAIISTNCI
ncbi:hypothetical protein POTOM_037126 [Populus tomentosa]|uniref:Uncharacterized protein n=1 Tax=Populus tomentosa TaxID=118781 RepID=A0A8X7YXH2_POPTO|nr:hypothetical protein POTOM_037126 [Populus tomentosa]